MTFKFMSCNDRRSPSFRESDERVKALIENELKVVDKRKLDILIADD